MRCDREPSWGHYPSPASSFCAAREALKVMKPLSPTSTTNPTTPCSPYDARHRIEQFRGISTERETHSPPPLWQAGSASLVRCGPETNRRCEPETIHRLTDSGPALTTEGPLWGHPRPVLGATDPYLEPFCGHLSPKIDEIFQK